MMFSSGKHAKLTADPEPWVDRLGKRRTRRAFFSAITGASAMLDPRPEFDRPLTNPANPILVNLRWAVENWGDESEDGDGPFADRYLRWAHYGKWEDFGFDYTPEERDHARRVLSRLARLT